MRCHYEVLNVARDVSDDELKKAYRKLALKWHPDKNPDNIEEAKQEFILIQLAYDILSNPQERAWYDKHRESILKGASSGYKDDSFDIYPYFSPSCFQGYDDSKVGFYTIYREVFNKLAAEESEYMSEDDAELPDFGDSKSSYDIVQDFYGFWLSFCTKKSFVWLNKYDISQAENHKILRLMEQENKKVRDKAKKERNEVIRLLTAFVRKRDKRVQAYAEYLKNKAEQHKKRAEENRQKMIAQHRKNIESYKESEWSKFSNLENELKDIESTFNDQSDETDDDDLFCVACNKYFKTEKGFENHEKSKKHKDNVVFLKKNMVKEEDLMNQNGTSSSDVDVHLAQELNKCELSSSCDSFITELPVEISSSKKKNKNSKLKKKQDLLPTTCSDTEIDLNDLGGSKKQKKKLERAKILQEKFKKESSLDDELETNSEAHQNEELLRNNSKNDKKKFADNNINNEPNLSKLNGSKKQNKKLGSVRIRSQKLEEESTELLTTNKKSSKQKKNENELMFGNEKLIQNKRKSETIISKNCSSQIDCLDLNHVCASCNESFDSKNKLFQHLKSTGHEIFLPTKTKAPCISSTKTKKKKR